MIAEKKKTTKAKAEPKEKAKAEPKAKKASTRSKVAEKPVAEPVKEHRFNFKLKEFNKAKEDFTVEEKDRKSTRLNSSH